MSFVFILGILLYIKSSKYKEATGTHRFDIVLRPGRRQKTSRASEFAAVDTRNSARRTISSTSRSLEPIPSDINACPGDMRAECSIKKSSLTPQHLQVTLCSVLHCFVSRVKFSRTRWSKRPRLSPNVIE